jgi:hypothetical protein
MQTRADTAVKRLECAAVTQRTLGQKLPELIGVGNGNNGSPISRGGEVRLRAVPVAGRG